GLGGQRERASPRAPSAGKRAGPASEEAGPASTHRVGRTAQRTTSGCPIRRDASAPAFGTYLSIHGPPNCATYTFPSESTLIWWGSDIPPHAPSWWSGSSPAARTASSSEQVYPGRPSDDASP